MRGKNLLSMEDFSKEEIITALDAAEDLKEKLIRGESHELLRGKTFAMLFERTSLRTRVSFEVAMTQLGGHAQFIATKTIHYSDAWGKKEIGRETLSDTYHVLENMVDGIGHRLISHKAMEEAAKDIRIPVINMASDTEHPCQCMADLLTIREKKGPLGGIKVFYSGYPGMAHSLSMCAPRLGMDLYICNPEEYDQYFNKDIIEQGGKLASDYGTKLVWTHDYKEAITDVDVVYNCGPASFLPFADINKEKLIKDWKPYETTADTFKYTQKNAIYLHMLPAIRDYAGATNEVLDGPHSVIFEEAGNRLHAQKGILAHLI
jgi:ornithine carbamoyltransferase